MFKGVTVALVTPFKDGVLDEKALESLIEFHIEQGTDTILPCGTTGESATLSHDEQKDVIKKVIQIADKRIKVMAGAGSNNTKEAVDLALYGKKAGADGILSIVPYYNKPMQSGIKLHFETIAKAVGDGCPLVLYNVPGRTSRAIEPETVAELYENNKNIIAIKEASGSLEVVNRILELCDIQVLSGDDSLTFPMMALGAEGVVSVAGNVVPAEISKMIKLFNERDIEGARGLHFKLLPIFNAMFIETNPIPVKAALALMGMINEEYRSPLCSLSVQSREKLVNVLKVYGLI